MILTAFDRFVFIQGEKGDDGASGSDGQPGIPVSLFYHLMCLFVVYLFPNLFSATVLVHNKTIFKPLY